MQYNKTTCKLKFEVNYNNSLTNCKCFTGKINARISYWKKEKPSGLADQLWKKEKLS